MWHREWLSPVDYAEKVRPNDQCAVDQVLSRSDFVQRPLFDASRNTHDLMTQNPEYGAHVAAASILIDASERSPRFMLLASVKSVF